MIARPHRGPTLDTDAAILSNAWDWNRKGSEVTLLYGMSNERLTNEDRRIAQVIADLGGASEVEIQSRTLKPLKDLRDELEKLEIHGLVRRRTNAFKGGYGDALELTELGYKALK